MSSGPGLFLLEAEKKNNCTHSLSLSSLNCHYLTEILLEGSNIVNHAFIRSIAQNSVELEKKTKQESNNLNYMI